MSPCAFGADCTDPGLRRSLRDVHFFNPPEQQPAQLDDRPRQVTVFVLEHLDQLLDSGFALRSHYAVLGQMTPKRVDVCVRWRTSKSRVRKSIACACYASALTATKCMVGRGAASAIASASAVSFFCRLTNGFT